jgi:hypothetical protein
MSAITKICTKCFQEKTIEDFGWKSKLLNRRHAVCKPCTAKRSNSWYYANKNSHIENVMLHKRESRVLARQFVWDYLLAHPCVDCGESDPVVLEFDHTGGKRADVSRLVADGAAIQRIKVEKSLTQIRCANCHRKKTAKERGWFSG